MLKDKEHMTLKDKEYEKKLIFIKKYVSNLWKNNKILPKWYTIHDQSHCEEVEKLIKKLIPEKPISSFSTELSEEEKFYLLSSAWLHDVGMIPGLFGKEDFLIIRRDHHLWSQKYVEENHRVLELTFNEATIIGEICKYHRKIAITSLEENNPDVRKRLLASYLRLADAIDISEKRIDSSIFNNILLDFGMPLDSKYHWLKNLLTKRITINISNLTINIESLISKNDVDNADIIKRLIEDDVRIELASIRDILISGGISYFLDVKTSIVGKTDPKYKAYLRQLIGEIQLKQRLSASGLVTAVSDTILSIFKLADPYDAYSIIKTYQNQVLSGLIKTRPSHMLIKRINKLIENNLKEDIEVLTSEQIKERINNLKNDINWFIKDRDECLERLFENTDAILNDCEPILLFGCSNLIIKALDKVGHKAKEKTKIYVCECKSKNQYNELGELVHCDGIEFASEIKKIGYKNVNFVPDILVANLISRKLVSKIIFGANGVNISHSDDEGYKDDKLKTGAFGHTAGHLTIADIAHLYKVPVYVILDSYKFLNIEPNHELERDLNWVSGDEKVLEKLSGIKLFNPREDIVEPYKVYLLVTDFGIFPPHQIPEIIKRKARDRMK